LKPLRFLILLIALLMLQQENADAQLFKKKKKKTNISGFVLQEAETPDQRKKAQEKRLVNPIRKVLSGFNLHISKSIGYFNYKSELSGVSVIRNVSDDQLFIVPLGEEASVTPPINGYANWFTDLTPYQTNSIDNGASIVRTDTVDFFYTNNGRISPWNFRLDYSFKKVDKAHLQKTGEKRYLDEDLFRVGIGMSFGSFKFSKDAHQQDIDPALGNYTINKTKISNTKMFGSASYNVYSLGDLAILADVYGGVWKSKAEDINASVTTYEPFFNFGVMFQTTWSKYFKGYIRPSYERRSYTLANESISVPQRFSIFSIDIGLILKYPTYPRNKYKAHMVQMEHVFQGKMYRGRPFYQKQNPRTGQRRNSKRGGESSFSIATGKGKKGGN